VRLGGRVVLTQQDTGVDVRQPVPAADRDGLRRREVDHEPAVAERVPGDRVAAPTDGDQQVGPDAEPHRGGHVLGVGAARDGGRPAVDRAVPDPPRLVVRVVGGPQQLAAEPVHGRELSSSCQPR
jgi:hypothetical protein